jgi:hypothetical protein
MEREAPGLPSRRMPADAQPRARLSGCDTAGNKRGRPCLHVFQLSDHPDGGAIEQLGSGHGALAAQAGVLGGRLASCASQAGLGQPEQSCEAAYEREEAQLRGSLLGDAPRSGSLQG